MDCFFKKGRSHFNALFSLENILKGIAGLCNRMKKFTIIFAARESLMIAEAIKKSGPSSAARLRALEER